MPSNDYMNQINSRIEINITNLQLKLPVMSKYKNSLFLYINNIIFFFQEQINFFFLYQNQTVNVYGLFFYQIVFFLKSKTIKEKQILQKLEIIPGK